MALIKARQTPATLLLAALLSVAAYGGARWAPPAGGVEVGSAGAAGAGEARGAMIAAARTMGQAMEALRQCRESRGIGFSPDDIHRTGLIGLPSSSITTTTGDLAAKRTTTDPNLAALMVYLLDRAGARPGDAVAIGASGSFPALIVASLAAAQAMQLHPVLIGSLGASQWGANDPAFTWVGMEDCLVERGVFPERFRAVALSLGGDRDAALELDPQARTALIEQIERHPAEFLYVPDLAANVQRRVQIYRFAATARGARIAAFVNIGANWPDLGDEAAILRLRPGLTVPESVPAGGNGVVSALAAEGVPIVHLLDMRGLAARYGLSWDPSPLPRPGEGSMFRSLAGSRTTGARIVGVAYLALLAALALGWRRLPWERRRPGLI